MNEGKPVSDESAVNQPRMLFKPDSWVTKIDFINHLILFNSVLITILSEKQGGKTSFSTLLQSNLDQQVKPISLTALIPCDRNALIRNIAAQLHLNHDTQTDIASLVTQINERKAHILLVIDEAQNLPESFIKEAVQAIKSQNEFGYFHFCLVSDYSLVATLNSLNTEQFNNLIHSIEVGSLNESETRTYVLQRGMINHLINKPLTDAQFKEFYQLTKGNVAKINSTLEAFIFKCSTKQRNKNRFALKQASFAFIAAATMGALFVGGFYKNSILDLVPGTEQVASTEQQNTLATQEYISKIASWEDSSIHQFVHNGLPKKQILDAEDEEQNLNTVAIIDKVVVIPKIKVNEEVFASKLVSFKEYDDFHKEEMAPVELKMASVKEANRTVIAHMAGSPYARSSNAYTIQIFASHKIVDVESFRKKHNLLGTTSVKSFINAKGTWYILTWGEFNNRNTATSTIKTLPPLLTKFKPWIRPLSGLSSVG